MIHSKQRLRSQRGFTLLEILIVLAIIGTIMGVVATQVMGKSEEANVRTAVLGITEIQGSLERYRMDTKKLPSSLQDLLTKPSGVKRWKGPYLTNEERLSDPWGVAYQYRQPGEHGLYDIYSFGADGKAGGSGTDADIGNWEL